MAALLWAQTRMRGFWTRLGSVRPSAFCRLSWTARLDLADTQQVGCAGCGASMCVVPGRLSPGRQGQSLAYEGHGRQCCGAGEAAA